MAEKKSKKPIKSVEESLWDTAISLRGTVEPSEYKHIVLGLIFLKFASDKFEQRRQELLDDGKEKYLDMVDFYAMKNVFYVPEDCRWDFLAANAKQTDLALKIDKALSRLEQENVSLSGALPSNYYSSLKLDVSKLSGLLDAINNINTIQDESHDLIGRVYEYFLRKFAIIEGRGKGEFYTPKNIVNLMAELIEPYKGKIYDPCCGSGGMFVQSLKFVEIHSGNSKDVAVYGQEATPTTYKLAKMNLAIRGISADLGQDAADTFSKDQHKDLKADFILANPPFNLKDWRSDQELLSDARWHGYDVPNASNANYAWILHMLSKLSTNGVGAFLLANGALSDPDALGIRKQLIENDVIEAIITLPREMFYSTDISVTMWIVNRNKKAQITNSGGPSRRLRDRSGEILFMDLRQLGEEHEKKYMQLSAMELKTVIDTFHSWRGYDGLGKYADKPEFCQSVNKDGLARKNYSLIPSKYIKFLDSEIGLDFEGEMPQIKKAFREILEMEKESQRRLAEAFAGLGHSLESDEKS